MNEIILNDLIKDIGANMRISKIMVKCTSELCRYNCLMIDMSNDIRICDKKSYLVYLLTWDAIR